MKRGPRTRRDPQDPEAQNGASSGCGSAAGPAAGFTFLPRLSLRIDSALTWHALCGTVILFLRRSLISLISFKFRAASGASLIRKALASLARQARSPDDTFA